LPILFALYCLIDYCPGEDQAVILTGESGSGKTEAGKLVLQYIAAVTHHSAEFHNIKYQLLQSNPVLEGRQLFSASHP
jgi:myosin heavy subunit